MGNFEAGRISDNRRMDKRETELLRRNFIQILIDFDNYIHSVSDYRQTN